MSNNFNDINNDNTDETINPNRIKRPKIKSSWLHNVTKSFKAAASENFQNYVPSAKDFMETNGEVLNQAVQSLRRTDVSFPKFLKNVFSDNVISKTLKDTVTNTIEDLKTGNFNNTERENEYMNSINFSGIENSAEDEYWSNIDLDSMNLDDADFGFDDNEPTVSRSSADKKTQINNIRVNTHDKSASSIIESNIKTTEAHMHNDDKNNLFNLEYNIKFHEENLGQLKKIDNNLTGYFAFQKDLATKVNDAALNYYKESLDISQKILHSLENTYTIHDNYYRMIYPDGYTPEIQKRKMAAPKEDENNPIDINGSLNLEKYSKLIKKQFIRVLEEKAGNSMDMMIAAFRQTAAKPLYSIAKAITDKFVPMTTKHALNMFNNTFQYIGKGIIERFNAMANEEMSYDDEESLWGTTKFQIKNFIGRVFGYKDKFYNTKVARYEKGSIPFDGVTKKAIVDVIPMYLRKILATLQKDEKDELLFDYENNRTVYKSNVMEESSEEFIRAISSKFRPFNRELMSIFKDMDINGHMFSTNDLKYIEDILNSAVTTMVKVPGLANNFYTENWMRQMLDYTMYNSKTQPDANEYDINTFVLSALRDAITGKNNTTDLLSTPAIFGGNSVTKDSKTYNISATKEGAKEFFEFIKDKTKNSFDDVKKYYDKHIYNENVGIERGNEFLSSLLDGKYYSDRFSRERFAKMQDTGLDVNQNLYMDRYPMRSKESSNRYKFNHEKFKGEKDRKLIILEQIRDFLKDGIVVYPNFSNVLPTKVEERIKLKNPKEEKKKQNKISNNIFTDKSNINSKTKSDLYHDSERYLRNNKENFQKYRDERKKRNEREDENRVNKLISKKSPIILNILRKHHISYDTVNKNKSKYMDMLKSEIFESGNDLFMDMPENYIEPTDSEESEDEIVNKLNHEYLLNKFNNKLNEKNTVRQKALDKQYKRVFSDDDYLFPGIHKAIRVPATMVEAVFHKANLEMYKLIFGKKIRKDGGIKILADSFSETFANLKKFLTEKYKSTNGFLRKYLLDPLFSKNGFFREKIFKPIYDNVLSKFGSWILDKTHTRDLYKAIKKKLKGGETAEEDKNYNASAAADVPSNIDRKSVV